MALNRYAAVAAVAGDLDLILGRGPFDENAFF
jgi:hypothetical protein